MLVWSALIKCNTWARCCTSSTYVAFGPFTKVRHAGRMRNRIGALIGLFAQVVFVVSWIVAPVWQGPRYSVLAHSISDMYAVTAPAGLFLVVVFTVCGAVTIAFLWTAVCPALRAAGWSATLGVILLSVSIFGLGDLLSPFERLACRLADPGCADASQLSNAGGAIDSSLSTIGVGLFVAGAVFIAVAALKLPAWKRAFAPLLILAIATFVFFVADGLLASVGLAGLFERLLALSGAATFAWLAVDILRRSPRTAA